MRDRARIRHRLRAAALVLRARDAILRPDFHRHADDVVTLLAQQVSGDARVHATAHSQENTLLARIHRSKDSMCCETRSTGDHNFLAHRRAEELAATQGEAPWKIGRSRNPDALIGHDIDNGTGGSRAT